MHEAAKRARKAAAAGGLVPKQTLLAAPGVAVNAARTDGVTPLQIAMRYRDAAVITALLAAPDVDVNVPDEDGWTPLHEASLGGHTATVLALLAHPAANVNSRTTREWGGDPFMVVMIPMEVIDAGTTPLQVARMFGTASHDVAALLEARGGVV